MKPNWEYKNQLAEFLIPDLMEKKVGLEDKLRDLRSKLKNVNDSMEILKEEESMVNRLLKDATVFDQNSKEIKKIDDDIKKIEASRNPAATGTFLQYLFSLLVNR